MANKTGSLDKNNFQLNGARNRIVVDTINKTASEITGDVLFMGCALPSNAVIHRATIENDALTGATDVDFGFYDIASAGNGLISRDCLVDGANLQSASTGFGLNGYSKQTIANKHKQLWEIAGLTADPKKLFQPALTLVVGGTAVGNIRILIEYSVL